VTGLWRLAATPSPSPTSIDPSSSLGSPGFLGFIVSAALAIAVIVLVRSMVVHLRRVQQAPGPDDGSTGPDDGSGDRR
jgi:hypothetical protein